MPYEPASQDEIFESLKNRTLGRSEKLTHFKPNTLNHTLGYHAFAGYFTYFEHALLAVQLGGWIDTAGGPISREDLISKEIDPDRVDLPLLNSMMDDEDLDNLARQNGVVRDPGDYAEGVALFLTTDESTVVPAGTIVATGTDEFDGFQRRYRTTEEASPETGTTSVEVPIEAERIGPAYNIGAHSLTEITSRPAGVTEVTNPDAIVGGEPEETNAELRERAKSARTQMSGGGTAAGIEGGIVDMIEGVDEDGVFVNEFYNPPGDQANYVEVTVDGGDDDLVREAIDFLHSAGIEHILNRPTRYQVSVTAVLEGSPINIDYVESEISRYIANLGLGENVNRAQIIKSVMNADDDISNITELVVETERTGVIEGDLVLEPTEKADAGAINAES